MSDRQIKKKIAKEFDYLRSKALELRAETENMAGEAKERMYREIDGLSARADRLKAEYENGELGEGLMDKISSDLSDLKDAFKGIRDRFK